jgi:hypothetical protein
VPILFVILFSLHLIFPEQLLKELELQMEALKTITYASSKANGAFLALIGKDFYSMFKVRTF